jgi:uncharacterized protein DUF6941
MQSRRVANCIFCDDVRLEVGNKLSLMGVYSNDILFPAAPPSMLQKLCVVVWLISDLDDSPGKLAFRILSPPDKKELARIEVNGQELVGMPGYYAPDEFSRNSFIRLVLPMINIRLESEGAIEVWIDVADEESFRAGRLIAKFNQAFLAQPAPSSPESPPSPA